MQFPARPLLFAALALGSTLASPVRSWAQYVVTGFSSASWGATDAALGLAGFVTEDFEDTTVASGLLVGWATEAGNLAPAAFLPATFDPALDDSFGTAFATLGGGGVWDGSRVLVNTRFNDSASYTGDFTAWGDIVLSFTTPVHTVGFSLQQPESDVALSINGAFVGHLGALTGLGPNGGRMGYFVVTAPAGQEITSLQLGNYRDGGGYDGFVIDHVAFAPIPEPAALVLILLGLPLLARSRRRATSRP